MRPRVLVAVLVLGLWPAALHGQAQQVRGRVIDASGGPVVGQSVLLHRIVGSSGANIAQARSDSAGRFRLSVDSAGGADAVYFLAARWQDELYISEAFQEPLGSLERVLQVGVPGTSATALLEGTMPEGGGLPQPNPGIGSPASSTRWLLLVVPAVGLLGLATYLVLRRRGAIPERRRLLTRIAELDLQHVGQAGEAYGRQRAELLAQLRDTPDS